MEVSLLPGGVKYSSETVRILYETVRAVRTAFERPREESLDRIWSKYGVRNAESMESGNRPTDSKEEEEEDVFEDGKADSGGESEDIDDIELVFTTGDTTDPGALQEDMVPIFDERKPQTHAVLVETDISKCGVIDEKDAHPGSRRNTLPDPIPYRPIVHREILAAARMARGSPRKVRPTVGDGGTTRQETGAQTDITAVPALWKSETYLAHKISYNLTTLPSKFALSVPRASRVPLPDRSREARRILLSDINFTSMVPELSRSADHLHQDEELVQKHLSEQRAQDTGRHGSRSSWGSRCRSSAVSITTEEPRRRHSCRKPIVCCHAHHSWSSVPAFRCHPPLRRVREPCRKNVVEHCCCPSGQSLPDLRAEWDSGESTDSLIDEAEEFLRRSIDSIILSKSSAKKGDRRYSEPDPSFGFEPPKSARPFLPKLPTDLKEDCLVKVIVSDGRIITGRIRYSGPVADLMEPYVGVELQGNTGFSDGTFMGRTYFDCKPDHAIFVPFRKVVLAWYT